MKGINKNYLKFHYKLMPFEIQDFHFYYYFNNLIKYLFFVFFIGKIFHLIPIIGDIEIQNFAFTI